MSTEPGGPDADDYVSGGSIRWSRLLGAGAGSLVTLAVVVFVDALNSGVTGLFDLVTTSYQGLAGLLEAPLLAGDSAIRQGARSAAYALQATGPFAFPIAVLLVAVTVSLIYWGVSQLVGG